MRSVTMAAAAAALMVSMGGVGHADGAGLVVTVESGRLSGEASDGVAIFRGVPYAAPPVGALRWRPPAPPKAWSDVRDARQFGPACLQRGPTGAKDLTLYGGAPEPTSEDCLTLNIWAPAPASTRTGAPVLVWLHGGSGRMGAGSLPFYDGTAFARSGVIMVTINYRLGHLGAFAHPALAGEAGGGDYALMDQIAALKWVRRNIAAFGGEPDNVTVVGESAGGISVFNLAASPQAQGLFHRAIIQSGGGWLPPPPGRKAARASGEAVARAAGAPEAADAQTLRALPARALASAPGDFKPEPNTMLRPDSPTVMIRGGWFAKVPLLIGINDGEDSLLDYGDLAATVRKSVKPATLEEAQRRYGPGTTSDEALRFYFRDGVGTAPARWVARRWSRHAPVYLYRFEHVDEGARDRVPRAPHGGEIAYVFKTLGRQPQAATPTAADQALADDMHARWVAFAKDGSPNVDGKTVWPAYDPTTDPWIVFGQSDVTVKHGVLSEQLDWYDRRTGWIIWLAWLKASLGRLF